MKIVLIGAGPSNIYLALKLLEKDYEVHLYEKTNSMGKKFLVAGKSGLNITHSEDNDDFSKKYFDEQKLFHSLFKDFNNKDLINWLDKCGIKTFVGSSGRVFPEQFKASQILKTWTDVLKSSKKFFFYPNCELTSISKNEVIFNNKLKVHFDKIVYALGGSSWKVTGSDGKWKEVFENAGIKVNDFKASNCGFEVKWSKNFLSHLRHPVKDVVCRVDDISIKGDLMLTEYGLEGTPIYSLSRYIRNQLIKYGKCELNIDLKPDLTIAQIKNKMSSKRKKDSLSNALRKKLSVDFIKINLMKEASSKDDFFQNYPKLIKDLTLPVTGIRPMDEAISCAGGLCMSEISSDCMIKKLPNHYAIGEMLDWETITGGYLLQGCFSMAHRVFLNIIV